MYSFNWNPSKLCEEKILTRELNVLGTNLKMVLKHDNSNDFEVVLFDERFRFFLQVKSKNDCKNKKNTMKFEPSCLLKVFKETFFGEEQSKYDPTFTNIAQNVSMKKHTNDGTKRRRIFTLNEDHDLFLRITYNLDTEVFHDSSNTFRFQSIPNLRTYAKLPDEMMLEIFKFLHHKVLLRKINLINKRFNKLVESEFMYRYVYFIRMFPGKEEKTKPEEKTFKSFVRYLEKERISIRIRIRRTDDAEEVVFRVKKTTPLDKVFRAYCRRKNIHMSAHVFHFDEHRMSGYESALDLDMVEYDIILCHPVQTGGKPVLLLYPPHDEFEVKTARVILNNHYWDLDCHSPITTITRLQQHQKTLIEWKDMKVSMSGEIEFSESSNYNRIRRYEYLFWEASNNKTAEHRSLVDFDDSLPIHCIPSSKITDFLEDHLLKGFGLKEKEVHNFITFWLNELMKNKYNLVQFMRVEDYEKMVQLDISPPPDQFVKVFMLFVGLESEDQIVKRGGNNIQFFGGCDESCITGNDVVEYGKKFVVVEWGGMNLVKSSWLK